MAHLWVEKPDGGQWTAHVLGPDGHRLGAGLADIAGEDMAAGAADVLLRRCAWGSNERWVLIAPMRSGIRVNARPVPGIRMLADRDEILSAGAGRIFFSTERPPCVEPFAGAADTCCALCKLPIETGTPAVGCPNCGVFYHENDKHRCWTRRSTCLLCDYPTALDAGYRWSPEQL